MSDLIDFRLGRWEDVLSDVDQVDAVITDPPYSAKTHNGHNSAPTIKAGRWQRSDGGFDRMRPRTAISYEAWDGAAVDDFFGFWDARCGGWFAVFSDSELVRAWEMAAVNRGRVAFHPLPCVVPGMTVRLSGDGPSSWATYLNVSRTKALHKWGTLPGAYIAKQEKGQHIGGKPLGLMRQIIRDYTRPGDLVCDPCAGGATTLIAAAMEGRRAIGCEMDPDTYAKAKARIERGFTPDLFSGVAS